MVKEITVNSIERDTAIKVFKQLGLLVIGEEVESDKITFELMEDKYEIE